MFKKVLLSLFILMSLVFMGFGASLQVDNVLTNPSIIKAGDNVELIVKVKNVVSINEDAHDFSYELKLIPKSGISSSNLEIIDGEESIGNLGPNEFWNAKFKVKVKEGASSGTYTFDLKIDRFEDGIFMGSVVEKIEIQVSGETFFVLDSTDKVINQGETKTFEVMLKNIGGSDAGSVEVKFVNTQSVKVVGTNSFYFQTIKAGEEGVFNLTLHASDSLPSGTYILPVEIKYNDGVNVVVQNIDAGVVVGGDIKLNVASVQTNPKEIRPGENYVLISLNLENSGDDAAKSIEARLVSDVFKPSYSDNNYVFVGRVDSGSFSQLKFYIDVPKNVSSGVYYLDLDLKYQNLMKQEFEKTLKVPIYIKEKPILEVNVIEAEGKAGSSMKVKVEVENKGEELAEEVDIRLVRDSSLPFTIEERSVYLGTIGVDEKKIAYFNIDVSSEAEVKEYSIRAFLRARGDSEIGDNNIYTYNKSINIEIVGKAINKLAVFGVLVAVLVLAGLFLRKKKGLVKKSK